MNYKYLLSGIIIAGGTIIGMHFYNSYIISHATEISKDVFLLIKYRERADILRLLFWGGVIFGGLLIWNGITNRIK